MQNSKEQHNLTLLHVLRWISVYITAMSNILWMSWTMSLPKPRKLNIHYPIERHSKLHVLATIPAREKEKKKVEKKKEIPLHVTLLKSNAGSAQV